MVKLSANLGFLWAELPLPTAIRAAGAAGFDAVECHLPYDVDPGEVNEVLAETNLPMLGLNTRPGDPSAGGPGLSAIPGRNEEARAHITEAIGYAASIDCRHVHVMAGRAAGPEARTTYVDNLTYAAARAAEVGLNVVIEPINQRDIPGYFLSGVELAAAIVDEVGADNLRIMFDCYHVQVTATLQGHSGDLLRRFEAHLPLIGHVQFAGVPSRAEPDDSEVDYAWLLPQLWAAGYEGFAGAEYRPRTTTDAGLQWMAAMR
ncbi:MAG: TIM barrel protein [Actinomycetia bacterium]|nr:TIM barrel protein [Actinomycetes bacterium]MCP5029893.1 TIM barrel protein [Actinomycetes bacterium]